jgi:hypothetical protein
MRDERDEEEVVPENGNSIVVLGQYANSALGAFRAGHLKHARAA